MIHGQLIIPPDAGAITPAQARELLAVHRRHRLILRTAQGHDLNANGDRHLLVTELLRLALLGALAEAAVGEDGDQRVRHVVRAAARTWTLESL